MKIQAIDDKNDLFKVEGILPESLITQIQKENLWEYPWHEQEMQTDWNRRKLLPPSNSPLALVDEYYAKALDIIAQTLNIKFEHKHCWSAFWLDYEGFDCLIHEDGAERGYTPSMAMQIYLTDSSDELGTVWYHDSLGLYQRYVFPYIKNSGYLMLNHAGQWHGMTKKIPPNHFRLSSYTYFGKFDHK